jgi:hypothetical protein
MILEIESLTEYLNTQNECYWVRYFQVGFTLRYIQSAQEGGPTELSARSNLKISLSGASKLCASSLKNIDMSCRLEL